MNNIIFFILGILIGCVFRFINKGEWFIMEIVWGLIFGLFIGVIVGALISDY